MLALQTAWLLWLGPTLESRLKNLGYSHEEDKDKDKDKDKEEKLAGEIKDLVGSVWGFIQTWSFSHPWISAPVQGARHSISRHH